ncbi:hypothetical protein K3495_g12274 [Podosphaera aphanis]|nr:hypothetical protein K3495_g12274 [Podosphaera aphanis]
MVGSTGSDDKVIFNQDLEGLRKNRRVGILGKHVALGAIPKVFSL